MSEREYQMLQDKLRKKLSHCNGLTGKRAEGYKEAILNVMSMVRDIHQHSTHNDI